MLIGIIWEGRTEGGKDTEGERGERTQKEQYQEKREGMELSGQTDLGQESGELRMGQVDPTIW